MILRARVVLPVVRPPIEDGVVEISGNCISGVGRWGDRNPAPGQPVLDLGEVILLPGLVNAHCHLDYTDIGGQIPPMRSFTDWIKAITAAKGGLGYADFARSWLRGAEMLLRTGTTTVADIEAVPELLPEVWQATPLRVFSFLELTGVKSRRDPKAILDEALRHIESLPPSRNAAGLSPHAPYSTVPELLRLSASAARQRGCRLATHVAESEPEFEMFVHGRGDLFDWLKRNERDMSDCGSGSPVQHLERLDYLSDNLLAVHVNYLAAGDPERLAGHGVSVVHCPRSHAFFGHRPFPRKDLTDAGTNLCLGTDSLATVAKTRGQPLQLDLFAEIRALASEFPELSPETIVRMATVNGARALSLRGKIGELSENAWADLIAVPFTGKSSNAYEAVVRHVGDVVCSMIDGQWALSPAK
jgi:cytosine/adenosine deaminase-related metal-dependent hydrolase